MGAVTWETEAEVLERLRVAKLAEIRDAFTAAAIEPVESLGIEWHGGMDSGLKLDAARRLSTENGLPTVEFYDTANVGHSLPVADALIVCTAVGVKYQTDFARKQTLMAQAEGAESEAELAAISW